MLSLCSCSPVSKFSRRTKRNAGAGIDVSGCRVERETDTTGWFGDGEYLIVFDCGGSEEKILDQVRGWNGFPLTEGLREAVYASGLAGAYGIPEIGRGAWLFYDRFPGGTDDRRSDGKLLSRPARDYTLVMYDADGGKLYYLESDT